MALTLPDKKALVKHFGVIVNTLRRRAGIVKFKTHDLVDMYVRQNGLCLLSGQPMTVLHDAERSEQDKMTNASIDRIDISKGYDLSNLQLIQTQINKMKNSMCDSDFIYYCRVIAKSSATKTK